MPEERTKDVTKLAEQSFQTIQDLERRIQTLQDHVDVLATRTSAAMPNPELGSARATLRPFLGWPSAFGSPYGAFGAFVPSGPQPPSPPFSPFGVGFSSLSGANFSTPPAPALPEEARSGKELKNAAPLTRVPPVDLIDEGKEFVLHVELPGVRKEDLEVMVFDRAVAISATSRPEVGDGAVFLDEVRPVAYRRTVPLPAECNTGQVKATLKDGILTLNVTKKSPANGPRRADVAYG